MKHFKLIAIALMSVAMVACGDDEPSNTYTREFNMIYPQHAAGHKLISKIEKVQDNGGKVVAIVDYDGDHVKKITVTYTDKPGSVYNEETIHFDYVNGAIICDTNIQDVTYAFEVNNYGAITKLTNVSTNRTSSALSYGPGAKLEVAQVVTPSSTDVTKMQWENDKISYWNYYGVEKTDSVAYDYAEVIPNKGDIDIPGNHPFTFTSLVCEVMRNAGLYGATSAYLPTMIKKNGKEDPETHEIVLTGYFITYTLDAEGYVQSYTTNETPKYTVKYTYK